MLLVGRRNGAAAMRASCLALAISPSAASIFSASGPTVDAFIAAVQAAPAEVKAIAFDVGANDGRWTKSLYTKLRALDSVGAHHRPLDLVMIEPLSNMKEQLAERAKRLRHAVTYLRAAAWWQNTTLTFFPSQSSISSSLSPVMAARSGLLGRKNVTAIDLAELLRRRVRPTDPLVFVKIDIEGAEYEVLPHLLLTGALCLVRYLVVEWHLNALPEPQRRAGLGLRLSLPMLLRAGCRHAPPVLYEDDALDTHTNRSAAARTINNHDVVIPGLAELVRKFAPDASAGSVFNRRRWEELHKELRTGRLKVPRQTKAVRPDEVAV